MTCSPYERLEEKYKAYFGQWKNKWQAIKQLDSFPYIDLFKSVTTNDCRNPKVFAYTLEKKLGIKIVCVPLHKDRDNLIKSILLSAIPVAVGFRENIEDCNHETTLDKLLSCDLLHLPECILKERQFAYEIDHYGNHLVLLWEADPDRLNPDVFAQLRNRDKNLKSLGQ